MDAIGNRKQKLHNLLITCIAVTVIAIITLACVVSAIGSDGSNRPVAEAATAITNSNKSQLFGSSNVSGSFELQEDITLSSFYTSNTFTGTLDGKNHTITITGSPSQSFGSAGSQTNQTVGALFGTVSGGTIKNVTVKYTGGYTFSATNGKQGSVNECTTLYAGIVCGRAVNNAKFESITLTIASGSKFAVMGYDSAFGGSDEFKYTCGQGAVAGGLIGRSESATLKNIVLDNNGSIHAHGENKDAGRQHKGNAITCSDPTRGDRANAGGLIGETANGTTTVTSLTVQGSGLVGAYTYGLSSGSQASLSHNINAAGLVLGATYDTRAYFNCSGIWFKATGKAYVAQPTSTGGSRTGLLVGFANATPAFLSLWRNMEDSQSAGVGIYSKDIVPTSPTMVSVSSTLGTNGIASMGIGEGLITYKSGSEDTHEYTPSNYVYYGTSNKISGNACGKATIVGLKDNKLDVEVNGLPNDYYVSSISYQNQGGSFDNYKNVYEELKTTYTFTGAVSATAAQFRVNIATISTAMVTRLQTTSKDFDNSGIEFEGTPKAGADLRSDLRWVAHWFDLGTPADKLDITKTDRDTSNDIYGEYGVRRITTNANKGIYVIALYKKGADGQDTPVAENDIIGADSVNAPSTIYRYAGSKYQCQINRKTLYFTQGTSVLSKVYDGGVTIPTLMRGSHYMLEDEDGNEPVVEPTISFDSANSKFTSKYVGKNIGVEIKGFTVTGNYQLEGNATMSFTLTGEITQRELGITWSNLSMVYDGYSQKPTATANNLVASDTVRINVRTYTSQNDYSLSHPECDTKDVGTYYAVAEIADTEGVGENYKLPNDIKIITSFVISPRPVTFKWSFKPNGKDEATTAVFKNSAYTVSCSPGNVVNGDTVDITLQYSLNGSYKVNGTDISISIFHVGDAYDAEVTGISNSNYIIGSDAATKFSEANGGTKISITPWVVTLKYYIDGKTSATDKHVLEYMGAPYYTAGSTQTIDGLQVSVSTEGTSLKDENLELTYNAIEVRFVGTYTATVKLKDTDGVLASDYGIANSTANVTIAPKTITVSYSDYDVNNKNIQYIYNGTARSVIASAGTKNGVVAGDVPEEGSLSLKVAYYRIEDEAETPVTQSNVKNAGTYKVVTSIDGNDNYVIAEASQSVTLVINPLSIAKDETTGTSVISVLDPDSDKNNDIPFKLEYGYTGNKIEPSFKVKYNTTVLTQGTDFTVGYGENINIVKGDDWDEFGNAIVVIKDGGSITIKGTGNFAGDYIINFKIIPGTITKVEYKKDGNGNEVRSFVYSGTAKYYGTETEGIIVESFEGFNTSVDGDPTYKIIYYSANDLSNPLTKKPVDVGSYVARVEFDAKGHAKTQNYVLDSAEGLTFSFEITPKPIVIKFKDPGTLIYDGYAKGVEVVFNDENDICERDSGKVTIKREYAFKGQGGTKTICVSAGEYIVKAILWEGDAKSVNYTISGAGENPNQSEFTISPKTVSVKFARNYWVYDGTSDYINELCDFVKEKNAMEELVSPILNGDNVYINLIYKSGGMQQDIAPINSGMYDIIASLGGTHSYNYKIESTTEGGTDSSKITFMIKNAEITMSLTNWQDKIYYNANSVNVSYSLNGLIAADQGLVALRVAYKDVTDKSDHKVVNECVNVGLYSVDFVLSDSGNSVVASNYTITNIDDYNGKTFEIIPRYLGIVFTNADTRTYSGENILVTAGTNNQEGRVEGVAGIDQIITGLVGNERVNVNVSMYRVVSEGGNVSEKLVDKARDVGTYKCCATLDTDGAGANYVLYEDEDSTYSLIANLVIQPKEIKFAPKNIQKQYGDSDASCDFTQVLNHAVLDTVCENDEIVIKLTRDAAGEASGESVGVYNYKGIVIEDADGDGKNYSISIDTANAGKFEIVKRVVEFEVVKFEIDYQDPIPTLEQKVSVITAIFGAIEVTITYQRENDNTAKGIYNLKETFSINNTNFDFRMESGSNLGKFVINGKSVSVTLDADKLKKVFGEDDPDLYEAIISVDVSKAGTWFRNAYSEYKSSHDNSDAGFPWKDYVRLEREKAKDQASESLYEHYRENGYEITLGFLNESGTDIDENYRAVFATDYKFVIEKKVLTIEQLFPQDDPDTKVHTVKTFDGNSKAQVEISSQTNAKYYAAASIQASAAYEDANAGVNKVITVNFTIMAEYVDDYVLPSKYVWPTSGVIEPKELTVTAKPADGGEDINLVYGAIPSIVIAYSGFIRDDSADKSGVKVVGQYKNDSALLNKIRDVGNHIITLAIPDDKYTVKVDGKITYYICGNYKIAASCLTATEINVEIAQRDITVEASGTKYTKPVDGKNTASINSDYYVIKGILEQDEGSVDIHIASQALSSATPGECRVNVEIDKLVGGKAGDKSGNYNLTNTALFIRAEILNLAVVSMADSTFDYSGTQCVPAPRVTDMLADVGWYLVYKGRSVSYGGKDGTTEAPKDAGSYYVECWVALYENDGQGGMRIKHKVQMATALLTINKVTPVIVFEGGKLEQEYGSFEPIKAYARAYNKQGTLLLDKELNVEYSFMNNDGTIPAFPPAGEHAVTAEYEDVANSNFDKVTFSKALSIKQKTITVNISDYTNLEYNGFSRENDIKVTFDGVVAGDKCDPIKVFSASEVKNAGSYSLVVKPGNTSYKITGINSVVFTIRKKTLYVKASEVTASYGERPALELIYDGFVGNEGAGTLEHAPSVRLTTSQIGENQVQYNKGYDKNYEFYYIDSTYTVVYQPKDEAESKNTTPYIVAACIVGGIGLVVALAFIARSITLRTVYSAGYSRKEIRKNVFGKDKRKR